MVGAGYVAIGTDGLRPVVWGTGDTEDAALANARNELPEDDQDDELTVYPATEAALKCVAQGGVGALDAPAGANWDEYDLVVVDGIVDVRPGVSQ